MQLERVGGTSGRSCTLAKHAAHCPEKGPEEGKGKGKGKLGFV